VFFIYKKRQLPGLEKNKKLVINNPPMRQLRILLITFDLDIIRNFLLPIKFITKDFDGFILLYRFQSIRNFTTVSVELGNKIRGRTTHCVLLPTKGLRHILRICILHKIPFHLPTTHFGGRSTGIVASLTTIKYVYNYLRINSILRQINLTG